MYLKSRGTEFPSKTFISRNLALLLCLSSFCAGMYFTNRYFFNGLLHFFESGAFSFACATVWLVRKCGKKTKKLDYFFLRWVLPYLEPESKTLI